MFALIRLVGSTGLTGKVDDTLRMLRLTHANECVLVESSDSFKGMLQKVKDYVTWGEVDKETLVELMKKRMRASGSQENRVVEENLKKITDYSSFENFAQDVIDGKIKISDYENLRPVFRLSPPSKGFKSVRETFPRGEAGYRGKEINELLTRMM